MILYYFYIGVLFIHFQQIRAYGVNGGIECAGS